MLHLAHYSEESRIRWSIASVFLVVLVIGSIFSYLFKSRNSEKSSTSLLDNYLVRRFKGLYYAVCGPSVIEQAYRQANGSAFTVSTPSNDHVMVSTEEHIKELIDAPIQQLSLHAVAKEMLQPKHTMHGFEWQEQRGVEGTGFVRALRSILTAHLPTLVPQIRQIIDTSMASELSKENSSEFSEACIFPMTKRIVTKVNCFIFFGEELSQNLEFTAAALEYPQSVIFAGEFLRITPGFLRPLVAFLTTNNHQATKTMVRYLAPIVAQRLELRAANNGSVDPDAPTDCMQWLIDTSPRKTPWTVPRMVGEIMAVWFGSVHQLSMTTTYALEDLCLHQEYVQPLREEIRQTLYSDSEAGVEGLPLLNSFIKESVRINNSDAITGRRKALTPYTFADGLKVNTGDWVCVPQKAMMNDPRYHPQPELFDGFRFTTEAERARAAALASSQVTESQENSSSFTEASLQWPIWGFGKTACPGRFYASTVLKLIMVHVLETYDCTLAKPEAPRSRVWRSSIVPRGDTVMRFQRRK